MTVVRICEKGTPFGLAALELELVRWWTDMGPRTPIVWNTDWLSPSVTIIKSQNVNVSVGHFGNGFATFLRELREQISRHSRRTMSMSQSQMRFVNFFGQNICKKNTSWRKIPLDPRNTYPVTNYGTEKGTSTLTASPWGERSGQYSFGSNFKDRSMTIMDQELTQKCLMSNSEISRLQRDVGSNLGWFTVHKNCVIVSDVNSLDVEICRCLILMVSLKRWGDECLRFSFFFPFTSCISQWTAEHTKWS